MKYALLAIHSNTNKLGVELFANVSKIEKLFHWNAIWNMQSEWSDARC